MERARIEEEGIPLRERGKERVLSTHPIDEGERRERVCVES